MKIFTPEYYDRFHCIASECPDSCCREWEIDVDEKTAELYRNLPGEFGQQLRESFRDLEEDGMMIPLKDGKCPMWRADGLCQVQVQLGHEALCQVCREFPRLHHDYGNFLERGLEMSCPEAARLILESTSSRMTEQEIDGGEEPDYEQAVMASLLRTRREILTYLDSTRESVNRILAVTLLYAHEVQEELDGGEPARLDPEQCLRDAEGFADPRGGEPLQPFFQKLEILTQDWQQLLAHPRKSLLWDDRMRGMIRYLIQRYWLQAVSDYDIVCRAKLLVSGLILTAGTDAELCRAAQLFSKEIENDPEQNVEAIFDAAYTHPAFTDRNLLSLLLF